MVKPKIKMLYIPWSFFAVKTTIPELSPTTHSFTRIFVPAPFDLLTTGLELTTYIIIGSHGQDTHTHTHTQREREREREREGVKCVQM